MYIKCKIGNAVLGVVSLFVGIVCMGAGALTRELSFFILVGLILIYLSYRIFLHVFFKGIHKLKIVKRKNFERLNNYNKYKNINPVVKLKEDCIECKSKSTDRLKIKEDCYRNAISYYNIEQDFKIKDKTLSYIKSLGFQISSNSSHSNINDCELTSEFSAKANKAMFERKEIENNFDTLFNNLDYIKSDLEKNTDNLFEFLSIEKITILKEYNKEWFLTMTLSNVSKYLIDGYVKIDIYTEDNEKVYSDIVGLPFLGFADSCVIRLQVLKIRTNKKYTVKMTPCKLWTYTEILNNKLLELDFHNIYYKTNINNNISLIKKWKLKGLTDKDNGKKNHALTKATCISSVKGEVLQKKKKDPLREKINKILSIEKDYLNDYIIKLYNKNELYINEHIIDTIAEVIQILAPKEEWITEDRLSIEINAPTYSLSYILEDLCGLEICNYVEIEDKYNITLKHFYLKEDFINEFTNEIINIKSQDTI